jgi:hypothetical protein
MKKCNHNSQLSILNSQLKEISQLKGDSPLKRDFSIKDKLPI